MNGAVSDIEKFINFSNVSISVWWYRDLEQKYDGVGADRRKTRMGPKYSTAVIDRLFFDIDCMRRDGSHIKENYEGMLRLWDWATEHDYRRDVSFTGGGYQMTIAAAKVLPENYSNTIRQVADKVNVTVDDAISLTDMRRYIGSYNYGNAKKSARNCWCISLKDREVHLPWYKHIRLSQRRRVEQYYYGSALYVPDRSGRVHRKRKTLDTRTEFDITDDASIILGKYGYEYGDICESIRRIIEQPHVRHMERIMVIKYLKDIVGVSYADCVLLLPKLLTAPHGQFTDGVHSVIERQPDTVYSRGLRFMPQKMKDEGYCTNDCDACSKYLRMLRRIRDRH